MKLAPYGIAQQTRPDLSPLMIFVDSQPADDHDRHRIWHVAPDTARRFRMRHNSANRQGIIAGDMLAGANDVGARSATLLVLQRPPPQPVVKRRLSAVELREIVLRA